jgi:hypothetical protein
MDDATDIFSRWARLGAMFDVRPARRSPDVERLLVDTAEALGGAARLLGMAVTWLGRYASLVCRHRLAALAAGIAAEPTSAALGYILTLAKTEGQLAHFNLAIKQCRPVRPARPLYDVYHASPALSELSRRQSDPLAKQWGLWAPPERRYLDAIRPTPWILEHNASLRLRALLGGQLSASIVATLQDDPQAGRSESELARACLATRKATREALDQLELGQIIQRQQQGRAVRIQLSPTPWAEG